ncbi:uracil-DNA glycosylase [Citricoccus sp. SGAir0253]|uniref:uracil-DNA glycosylase n=1 Tax=Citricoccus sp. SGAir0253 TaxID=2567881 RepID=UPI0010CD36CC|nr:uracil-DNA glycosylase [Citricoccus sp. SGAir0253]QCU78782.1 uracil-DNA glycosylase [Citricoccus sp. SGAir0253]
MRLLKPLETGWERALAPQDEALAAVGQAVEARRAAGEHVLPERENILRAFRQPFDDVRVLILGQDPYPTPGHPIGLSFAVERHVRPLPRSLANIYRELSDDLGIPPAEHGDLSAWAEQGVLLLNRVLTVAAGEPASHRGLGWEGITEAAVAALAARPAPLVAILWGADARRMAPLLRRHHSPERPLGIIESPHPSPLSAHRGFFGSRPFSRANEMLVEWGAEPVDWRVERPA